MAGFIQRRALRPIVNPLNDPNAPVCAFPASDITAGSWTPSTGVSLFAVLDEADPNDTDYILSASSPAADTAEVRVGTLVTGTRAILRVRHRQSP